MDMYFSLASLWCCRDADRNSSQKQNSNALKIPQIVEESKIL